MNTAFLTEAARRIWETHGPDLTGCTLLLPSKRNILFFRKELARAAGRPVWAPEMYTLDSLTQSLAKAVIPDELAMMIHLHTCWQELGHQDSLESFYTLGQLILRDFDSLDKALADPAALFARLLDIPALQISDLEDTEPELYNLVRAIQKQDLLSRSLTQLWEQLPRLYDLFDRELDTHGITTSGKLYRRLATTGHSSLQDIGGPSYAIGFYQLSAAEAAILGHIGGLQYYWDLPSPELSAYIGWQHPENALIQRTADRSWLHHRSDETAKTIHLHATSGRQRQLQGLTQYLPQEEQEAYDRAAVLLPEQGALMPLLQILPGSIRKVNVSMGLSVLDTPVFTLVHYLLEVLEGWKDNRWIRTELCRRLFSHELLQPENELLAPVWVDDTVYLDLLEDWKRLPEPWRDWLSPPPGQQTMLERCLRLLDHIYDRSPREIDQAAVYHLYTRLHKLKEVLDTPGAQWSPAFFSRLLRRILQHSRITLKGEPLEGLQILGPYEMANLQFDRLYILHANEGLLPSVSHSSLLPGFICQAFGLPSISRQMQVQEHLFWSSVVSAGEVHFFFNSEAGDLGGGEPSRWIQALRMGLHPPGWTIRQETISVRPDIASPQPIVLAADPAKVQAWMQRQVSITAIQTWLTCRLKFYLQYILGYRQYEAPSDEVDAAVFGVILHEVMYDLYTPLIGRQPAAPDPSSRLSAVPGLLDKAYCRILRIDHALLQQGSHLLFRNAILHAIRRILLLDTAGDEQEILATELPMESGMVLDSGLNVRLYGKADRVDRTGGRLRIVDYKTGAFDAKLLKGSYEKIWARDGRNDKEALQTLFYAWLYQQDPAHGGEIPDTHLYFARGQRPGDDTLVQLSDMPAPDQEALVHFGADLRSVLAGIADPATPVDQTDRTINCIYCPYKAVCNR